jgi:hypothetical protein
LSSCFCHCFLNLTVTKLICKFSPVFQGAKTIGIKHVRGKPNHPQTQGKIERYHRSMKNVVKLDNYYSPEELKKAISDFVHYYNNHRYHEALNNLRPCDVYFRRAAKILKQREKIKNQTLQQRRRENLKLI